MGERLGFTEIHGAPFFVLPIQATTRTRLLLTGGIR